MKKMVMPAFIAALMLVFSLVGCSGAQSMNDDTLKGTWALDKGTELGFDAYVNFGEESTFEMMVADGWLSGTWSVSGTEATLTFEPGMTINDAGELVEAEGDAKTAKMSYSNNKLTLGSSNGSKLVFVKDDSEETKSMFSGDLSSEDGQEGATAGNNQELEYVDEAINPIDPAVSITNDDKFAIQVVGKGTDYTGDPCYKLSITNKTDKDIYIVPQDEFTVGGKTVEAGIGEEIAAGETAEAEMYFPKDDLGGGLEALAAVDGILEIYDSESDDEALATYTFHMA